MSGMAPQPGIVYVRHGRMALQGARQAQRRLVLPLHAHLERLQAAVQQEAGMRIERPAQVIQLALDRAHEVLAPDHGAADDVGMAVEVLRAAVQAQVEAALERAEVHRAREGVVDDGDEPAPPAEAHDLLEVRESEQGIAQTLHVEGLGVGPQGRRPGPRLAAVDEGAGDPEGRQVLGDQVVRAAVEAVLHDEVIAGRQQRQQRRRDRGHAAGRDESGLAAFDGGELLMKSEMIGRVVEPDVLHVVIVRRTRVLERGGLEDRQADGALDQGAGLSGVDEGGGEALSLGLAGLGHAGSL